MHAGTSPKLFGVSRRPRLWRYGVAVLAVGLATLLTVLVPPIATQIPFALYFAAILLVGFYGGFGPSLLATVMTVLVADYLFIAPAGTILRSANEWLIVGTFGAIALLLATVTHLLQHSQQVLQERDTERKRVEIQLAFLAHASMELSVSLDYRVTLQRVAELAVPELADWCAVDMITPEGTIDMVACAHVDPAKVRWAYELRRSYPPSLDDREGLAQVIRSGTPEFYPHIPPEWLDQPHLTEEQRRILNQIGFSALITVPMRARGQVLGALTLVWAESGRHYSDAELALAEDLAARAAIAVDNARLYEEAQLAEHQQAELLAQMEALFANAPIGIAFFDRQMRFVRINDTLAAMYGLPAEAHLEHSLGEVLPEYREVFEPYIRQVFATGEGIFNVELNAPAPSDPDDIRYFMVSWYPVMVVDGQPLYVGTMVIDVTASRKVEQALRTSEMRFRWTFEQAAVGMSHVSNDGRWLRVNDRLCAIVGYTRSEMMQRTFQAITHPDDVDEDVRQKSRVIAGEIDGYHMEKRYIRKDGSLVWVNLTVSAVRAPGNRTPEYMIAVVEDINERKSSEFRLELLADLSQVLATTLGDAQMLRSVVELFVPRLADWCVVNLDSGADFIEPVAFAHVEPAQRRALATLIKQHPLAAGDDGGTPAVIRTGQSYFLPQVTPDMLRDDDRLSRLAPIGAASLIIVPLRIREASLGAMTLARCSPNRPFTAQDLEVAEEVARRVGMAVDNARLYRETRATEAQLRLLNETLEERVAERTAELERSNRELDRFAYVASHDLKAPLRAIESLAFWIEEDAYDALPESSRTHLRKLRSRVRRMERLLEDLLSYSRAGRILHEVEEVDTGALARSVFDLLAPPPSFTLLLNEPMPIIRTQRVPLETVLRNLMGNAIKHHHRDDGTIELLVQDLGERVEFSITDDGPGIASSYHARVFEMFQTLQPRDHVEGSGMGLAIVKKLVESFGGTIGLHSAEGAGATFCFTWPKSKVAD